MTYFARCLQEGDSRAFLPKAKQEGKVVCPAATVDRASQTHTDYMLKAEQDLKTMIYLVDGDKDKDKLHRI